MEYDRIKQIKKRWMEQNENEKLELLKGNIFMDMDEKEILKMINGFIQYEYLDDLVMCVLERGEIDSNIVDRYFKLTKNKKKLKTKLNRWSTYVILCLWENLCYFNFNQVIKDDVVDYEAAYEQALKFHQPSKITKIFDCIKISSIHFDQFMNSIKNVNRNLYGKTDAGLEERTEYSNILEKFMNLGYVPGKEFIDDLLINGRVIHLDDEMLNRMNYSKTNFGYIVRMIREMDLKPIKNIKMNLNDDQKEVIKKTIFGHPDKYSAIQTKNLCKCFGIKIDFSCMELFSDSEAKSLAIYNLLRNESIKPDFKCLVKLVSHYCSHRNVKHILDGLTDDKPVESEDSEEY